jgi:4-hydroxyphenylpyruvate dioxygenase
VRTCIATVSLSGTLEQKLSAAAAAGFDAVELFEPDLIASSLAPAEVRDLAADLGLEIPMYQPLRDFEGVGPDAFERNLKRARRKLELMEELGAETLLVCSNVAADAVDDPALSAAQLRRLADEAVHHGVRIAYEALAWGTHVRDYRDACRIVELADHPGVGTCLDSFHILSRGSDPAGIGAIPGEKIFFLQLADAPVIGMEVLQWSRHYRCFPGQGEFDIAAFTASVRAAGYTGPLSLEVFNDVFRHADPERIAVDAMRSLMVLEEQLGERSLPSAPVLRGLAFVELAVGSESGPETSDVLAAMGFRDVGPHRSKPVHLWEHGDARVLLNHGDDRTGDDPLVVALGVESADPMASQERAEALLASVPARRRGPGEADLPVVAAPDGTAVFFCRSAPAEGSWLSDFVELDGTHGESSLDAIDHVVLSQPFDYFDEAALFYRSVLGLRPRKSEDLPSPEGLLRSRAVSDAAGRVRLPLTVPRLAGGEHGRLGELQHVAFASHDVLAAARRLRDYGAPLLAIPDNYYDDLAARVDLDDSTIELLRELGVLYDADGRGEFLHFFTRMVGGRLFFEVVERRGGYDGYGAANSPVRLSAHLSGAATTRPAWAKSQGQRGGAR